MKINNEVKNYIFWFIKNIFNYYIYIFYLNKLFNKLFIFKKNHINKNINFKFSNFIGSDVFEIVEKNNEDLNHYNTKIQLATKQIIIEKDINWNKEYLDSEDYESLHRFNWVMTILSDNSYNDSICWINQQENIWNNKHINTNKSIIKNLIWEPYTVSERLTNLLIYHYYYNKKISITQINSYLIQLNYLKNNLEFYYKKTGNHYFNNLRCLYIASCIFKINDNKKIIIEQICKQLDHILTKDFFLREGSSHYHLLFTRWLIEIYIFSIEFKDLNFSIKLKDTLKFVIDKVNFYKIKYDKNFQFPMIGDISPDFNPSWLLMVDDFSLDKKVLINHQRKYARIWNNIFRDKHKNNEINFNFTDINYSKSNSIFKFPNSGWYRYNYEKFSLILRLKEKSYEKNIGHYHNDQFHFCLYYRGKYIFVDNGRHTYDHQNKLANNSILNFAHNSILLDNIGSIPLKNKFFYHKYYDATNNIKSKIFKNKLYIFISSNAFQRINKKVLVTRVFIIEDKKFKICDKILGYGKLNYKAFFYLKPDIKIEKYKSQYIMENKFFNFTFSSNNNNLFIKNMSDVVYSESYGQYSVSKNMYKEEEIQLPAKIEYEAVF